MYINELRLSDPIDEGSSFHQTQGLSGNIRFEKCMINTTFRQYACLYQHCRNQGNCLFGANSRDNEVIHALTFHPDDIRILHDLLLPDLYSFMKTIPVDELVHYRFVFNHRYLKNDQSVSQFIQEGRCSWNSDHQLILSLNVFSELGDIKADDSLVLTIHKYCPDGGSRKVFTKSYCRKEECRLSARELDIVRLCSQGLSSKMIAERLHLSIHTVKNHKRNSMEKTGTCNIAELVHLTVSRNWI